MTAEVKLKRAQCNYEPQNARFLLECDFSKQYHHYYLKRLNKTRPYVEFNCRLKWGSSIPIYNLSQLAAITSCQDNDLDYDIRKAGVNSPVLSPILTPSTSAQSDVYPLMKRIRRSSQSSQGLFTTPKTSTQKEDVTTPIRSESPGEVPTLKQCIVIGTLFKKMKLQPDVLKELSRGDFRVKCENYLGHFGSQGDRLILEDEDESISLTGAIAPDKHVTGIVVALLGTSIDEGSQFVVQDICYAEPNRQVVCDQPNELSRFFPENPSNPIYLMVISGLGFRPDMGKRSVLTRALQNLIDFVWGGSRYEDDPMSSLVARILVVGDCLDQSRFLLDNNSLSEDLAERMRQSRQVKPYTGSIQSSKHMDDFFAQLSKTINVDVMPGPSDPSSHLMPQQPFHPCMFPKSSVFSTFNCSTNPHRAFYDDEVDILSTSGQNIDIISKFSGISDPIEIMKCHLRWGNSAPSAPDNLYSVPYEDDDPFVIDYIPDIYIAGCQESFRTDYHFYPTGESSSQQKQAGLAECKPSDNPALRKDRTLLMTVPRFCESHSCVLINLKNLESQLISFATKEEV